MTTTLQQSQDEVARLVKQFSTNRAYYLAPGYNEADVRQEFIDPLFVALGWDVHNTQGNAPYYREVMFEAPVDKEKEGEKRTPDYVFSVGRERKFFAEAKKPGVNIKTDFSPAYQLRSYAWSAKLPLSILTDFEEFAVYDCRAKPSQKDKASAGRTKYCTFDQYADLWREIWDIFSRPAVLGGSFDQFVESEKTKRGTNTVDNEFLKEIEAWRGALAQNIALRNPRISISDLNDAVQRTIDRIIFLRMAEDRGTEAWGQLGRTIEHSDIYDRLVNLYAEADKKYNSGLFDFSAKGDTLTPRLKIDDSVLKSVVGDLYFPKSPYQFNLLPLEILGKVYEQFLGKVIHLTPSHQARIEEKPEVRKAGGVVYTPTYIVDYLVARTVGQLVEGKTPQKVSRLRILDIGCGSGTFLLGAYSYLLDWHLRWYSEHEPEKHKKEVYLTPQGYRLTTAEKKRILLNNIYGVDIDRQAVEVTKLSLLLKVLEGENQETLGKQLSLFKERALPNLDKNIKCGNSLIGPDYFENRLISDEAELQRINPFDWEHEFPEIMKAGGFDCVIGNPPYVRQEWLSEVKTYFQAHYKTFQPTADLYVNFIEKGHRLLNRNGLFGMIVSNKWLRAAYGKPLRKFLAEDTSVLEVVDLAGLPVFANTTVRTIILVSSPKPKQNKEFAYVAPVTLEEFRSIRSGDDLQKLVDLHSVNLSVEGLSNDGWSFSNDAAQQIISKMLQSSNMLKDYVHRKPLRGLITGFNEAFIIDRATRDGLIAKSKKSAEIIKPLLAGRDVRRYTTEFADKYLIWTYIGVAIEKYPAIFKHLKQFQTQLEKRWDKGPHWWELRACDYYDKFEEPKIIYPDIATACRFALDRDGYFSSNTTYFIPSDDLYLLGILNSKLGQFYFSIVCAGLEGGGKTYLRFFGQYLEGFPIRTINFSILSAKSQHDRVVALVEQMLELHKNLNPAQSNADRELYERQIKSTDSKIDKLIYELYELTEEEIKIVEGEN